MAIEVALVKYGTTKNYQVAYLDYDKLIGFDPTLQSQFSEGDINDPATVAYATATYGASANLKYYRVGGGGVNLKLSSPYLEYSMLDVIKPSNIDPSINRLVDYANYSTGVPLEIGSDSALAFSQEQTFPVNGPPSDIVTRTNWFRKAMSYSGYNYILVHQVPTDGGTPLPICSNTRISAKYSTTTGNTIGCALGYRNTNTTAALVAIAESSEFTDNESLFPYDFTYGARVQGSGYMANIPEGSGVPGNGNHVALEGSINPYEYGGVHYDDPRVTRDVTIQPVATRINGVGYIGFIGICFNGDTVEGIQGNFYPTWFWGSVSGVPDDPDNPDKAGEDWNGPSQTTNNVTGNYHIVQNPPGVAGTVAGAMPYAGTSYTDAGYHIYVFDNTCNNELMEDMWGKHLDSQIGVSGIINYGMIPYEFLPIDSTNPDDLPLQPVEEISYGGLTKDVSGSAWHVNHKSIVVRKNVVSWDTSSGLNRFYGNYLDYEPYTNINLSIPYCGSIDIPPSKCIGGSITVSFTVNIPTGDICASILCKSEKPVTTDKYGAGEVLETRYYVTGNCLSPLPLASRDSPWNNRLDNVFEAVAGVATAISGGYSGNPAAIAGGVHTAASSMTGIFTDKPKANNAGGTPSSILVQNQECILEISRPSELADDNYKKISGTPAGVAKTLEDIEGLTTCLQVLRTEIVESGEDAPILKFSGSPTELSEIKRILQEGVIL